MSKNSCPAIEGFHETCRRIIYSSLSESAGKAALLFMQRIWGAIHLMLFGRIREEFTALWRRFLGEGMKVLVHILVAGIDRERGLNISPERFLELMCSGNQDAKTSYSAVIFLWLQEAYSNSNTISSKNERD
ncbi:MAG: hypothetical protein QW145_00555 [Candidatus Bathyarchaeia archaeon]